ncbi:Uncharacterized membrane protein YoaK, UPF0700 family [Paractinoplanes atraurantiacus]|uniref:Uncharacterized membrane protein YoaK, UPF0700 family n=2 Tax=Paractinoplanes atraurantiacus TaxID=1036182 RepID=A0A285JM49_9ACTN|nr:Uncharacterized membrane protein YoaK, UPF0700 family [Actinoplanes atraurantiacus]
MLLAATAGSVDLLALTVLGGAFASIITGNLVTLGFGIGAADAGRVVPVAIAVTAYAIGVLIWRFLPRTVTVPLLVELALLAVVAGGLLTDPGVWGRRILLAVAAMAMGGQSVVGLRLRASTTYMTGALATALTGDLRKAGPVLLQLASLVAGAAAAAALMTVAHWAAYLLPLAPAGLAVACLTGRTATARATPGAEARPSVR